MRVPLIRKLIGSSVDFTEVNDEDEDEDFDEVRVPSPTKKSKKIDTEEHILLHRNRTVVTPTVARIANGLFGALCVAGQSSVEEMKLTTPETSFSGAVESDDEPSITWLSEPTDSGVYNSVLIDEVVYNVSSLSIRWNILLMGYGLYRLGT